MSAEAEQIRRERIDRNLATLDEAVADLRRNLSRDRLFCAAADSDEVVRAAKMVQAATVDMMRATPWPGVAQPEAAR